MQTLVLHLCCLEASLFPFLETYSLEIFLKTVQNGWVLLERVPIFHILLLGVEPISVEFRALGDRRQSYSFRINRASLKDWRKD